MDLIKEIREDNTTLHRLTVQTHTLQVSRRSRHMPDFHKIRSSATSIFEGLQKTLQASCVASHRASIYLGLSTNCSEGSKNSKDEVDSHSFRILLHHDLIHGKQKALAWSIEEAEVRMIDGRGPTPPQLPLLPSPSPGTSQRKKVVGFQLAESASRRPALPQDMAEIQDLCGSLQDMRLTNCGTCLGYMKTVTSEERHGLYWPEERLVDQASPSFETLANILGKSTAPRYRWTNADARKLAVPLAAGVLRLYDTPWLEKTWSKEKITVVSQNGKILTEHPFISESFNSATSSTVSTTQGSMAAVVIRNPTLFALGVVLIEMCMGKSLDRLRQGEELNSNGTKHDLSDYQTSCRLLNSEEISDRFGQRWSDVARRCIYCDLNQAKTSLEDIGFQKAVYNEVFAELEEEHRQFFNLGGREY